MKFAPILAFAPVVLAAPLGLKPTPVRRQEDAALNTASADSSIDLAALAGVTLAAENAQATDLNKANVDNAILYNTIANAGLDGVETLSTELIAGVFSTETQSSTFVGADGVTTVVVAITASGVDTSIVTLQTNNVVSGQFNVDFQQQFVNDILNVLIQQLLLGQNVNANQFNLGQLNLGDLLAGGQIDLNDLIASGLFNDQLFGNNNFDANDLLNLNLNNNNFNNDFDNVVLNQNDINNLLASGLINVNDLNNLLGVNSGFNNNLNLNGLNNFDANNFDVNGLDNFNLNGLNNFNNNVFDVNQQQLDQIIAQLVAILVTDFNAVSAFGGLGINSVDVNGFQQFFNDFAVNLGGFDNVDINALAQFVALLQQLSGAQVVDFFGKQDQLFNAQFLDQFGVNNDFGAFVNNFDDILGGLNNVDFDQNDLFNLIALAQLIAGGQINLNQANLFNAFGLNNNFGNGQDLNDLLLSLGVNNLNGFNVNGLNNNDIADLLSGVNSNVNVNGLNNNVNLSGLNSVSNLNSLVAS